jgi:hypothetical protein
MSNRKRGRWGLVLGAAAVLVTSTLLTLQPASPAPLLVPENSALPEAVSKQALVQLEAKTADIARQRLAELPEPAMPDLVGGFSRETVRAVLGIYREMLAVRGLYNQNVTRERLVAQILDSPQGLDVAAQALSDLAFTREAFGELQAEARIFSIEVLKAAARRGHDRQLLRSAEAIAQELARSDNGAGELNQGRAADLRDLVHAFVDVKGVDAFASGDVRLVHALGFSPSLPPSVKHIYDEVLFFRLKSQYGRERAAEMTASLLDR